MAPKLSHRPGDVVEFGGVTYDLLSRGPRTRSFWAVTPDRRLYEVAPESEEVLGQYLPTDDPRYPAYIMREVMAPLIEADANDTASPSAASIARKTGLVRRVVDAFLNEADHRGYARYYAAGVGGSVYLTEDGRQWAADQAEEVAA